MGQVIGWDALLEERDRLRQQGMVIGWTNGCFDLFHVGLLAVASVEERKMAFDSRRAGDEDPVPKRSLRLGTVWTRSTRAENDATGRDRKRGGYEYLPGGWPGLLPAGHLAKYPVYRAEEGHRTTPASVVGGPSAARGLQETMGSGLGNRVQRLRQCLLLAQ